MNMDNAISPDYDQSPQLSEGGAVVVFVFAFLGLFLVVASCSRPKVPKTETNGDSPSAADDDGAAGDVELQTVIQREPVRQFPLPLCTFHQLKDAAAASTCTICLADFEGGEAVRMMPECCHVFHRSCIDPLLTTHATCPACWNPTLLSPPPIG